MLTIKKVICILSASLLLILNGCEKNSQSNDIQHDSSETLSGKTPYIESQTTSESVDAPADPSFKYEELTVVQELEQAEYLHFCYSDDTMVIISVGAEREESWGERSCVTKFICVCNADCEVEKTYNIPYDDTDVISAVPYKNGIAYIGFEDEFSNGKYNCEWQLIYTDGEKDEILDSGICSYYDFAPNLFLADNELYYLYGDRSAGSLGFVVRMIEDGFSKTIIEKNDARLCSMFAKSNGDKFCFLAEYPDREFATFFICNSAGILYEHDLNAKITSYSINDVYAICGTGDEENYDFAIELVVLSNGEVKSLDFPYGSPLYCMTGNADSIMCVNYSWKPYYVDVSSESFVSMPLPLTVGTSVPIDFVPLSDSDYLFAARKTKRSSDGAGFDSFYEIYRLTISK